MLEQSERSRVRVAESVCAWRRRLDVPAAALGSIRRHPVGWLGGALGAGVLGAWVLRRRPVERERRSRGVRGLVWAAVATAARPVIKTWLAGHANRWVASALKASQAAPSNLQSSHFPSRR